MTITATETTPTAAAAAAEGQTALNAAKDHLAALERAAAQGLEVNATDFNTAVTEVDLKTRRQAFLDREHTAESAIYATALFDAATRMKAAAQAEVDAIQTILDRAQRLAAEIEATATQESYGATLALGLPRVDQNGDLDGELCNMDPRFGLFPSNPSSLTFRLNGRVFGPKGEVGGSFVRPANG